MARLLDPGRARRPDLSNPDEVANSLRSGGFPLWVSGRIRTRLPILRHLCLIDLNMPSFDAKGLTGWSVRLCAHKGWADFCWSENQKKNLIIFKGLLRGRGGEGVR
ncbi:MAG: hypothetical protein EBZ08_05015 [Betaproteobacteria bacterium]|nr:hypothetical protein [Betaproteobacteria bacterium]